MALRSSRRFLNLISLEVLQGRLENGEEEGGIHRGQESFTPLKAINADQIALVSFRLQAGGGLLHINDSR
jgi:hypothetical protein